MKKTGILLFTFFLFTASIWAYDDAFTAQKAGTYTIDGMGDEDFWASAEWYNISYVWLPYGTSVLSDDFNGRFKLAWTEEVLLVLAEIEDDVFSDQHTDPLDSY